MSYAIECECTVLQHSIEYFLYISVVVSFNALAYTVIGLCVWRITRHMRQLASDSDMLLCRERRVRQVLLLQTLIPALAALTIALLVVYSLIGGGAGPDSISMLFTSYVSMPTSWIPVGNALATLTLISPYRRWVVQRCCALSNQRKIAAMQNGEGGQGAQTSAILLSKPTFHRQNSHLV